MAFGFIKVLPASTHTELALSGTGGGSQYPSIKVLNPNDGVVYVARNRDCTGVNFGAWDWKVPSQSYAILPGPFSGVGMFYLDQSGAGRQGEITVYASQQKIEDPAFIAVGRALQAQSTTLDIVEGVTPGNPGAGIARLWADALDFLHILNAGGVDATVIDNLTALGGALAGTLPNPGMAAGAAAANVGAIGGDLTGFLPNPTLGASVITAGAIGTGAVTTPKLAIGAVYAINFTSVSGTFTTTSTTLVLVPGCQITNIQTNGGSLLALGWCHGTHGTAGNRIGSQILVKNGVGLSAQNIEQRFTAVSANAEGTMFNMVYVNRPPARGDYSVEIDHRSIASGTATTDDAGCLLLELLP